MSTQKGNVKRSRPQKFQNKSRFKNVYHDTSIQTQRIVNTDITGVCARCKDCIDWKIKYKKYKPLTQPKTCAICKQKTVKLAYHVYCTPCSIASQKCAKCGDKKDVVLQPQLSVAEQASEDREFEFELEQLPERKRRTYLRLQEKGLLTPEDRKIGKWLENCDDDDDDGDYSDDDGEIDDDIGETSVGFKPDKEEEREKTTAENQSESVASGAGIDTLSNEVLEAAANENSFNKDDKSFDIEKLSVSCKS